MKNNYILDEQYGFLPGLSVATNLLQCCNSWTKSLDVPLPVDVVFLDFSRAFNKVPTRHFLYKLKNYQIRDKLLKWIKNWLKYLQFQVEINGRFSSVKTVLSVLLEGSVLSPMLFLIYTMSHFKPLLKIYITEALRKKNDSKKNCRASRGPPNRDLKYVPEGYFKVKLIFVTRNLCF